MWSTLAAAGLLGCADRGAAGPAAAATAPTLRGADPEALARALAYGPDDRDPAKVHAAVLLGVVGREEDGALLARCARGERNEAVRAACVRSLGARPSPDAEAVLTDALLDPRPSVRLAAVDGLASLPGGAGHAALAELAAGSGPLALAALGELRWGSVEVGGPDRYGDAPRGHLEGLGTSFHVDATAGDDGAEGTAERPFRTLARAVEAVTGGAGDRILATAGEQGLPFREQVDIPPDRGGTPSTPTVLAAWPGRPGPILDGGPHGARREALGVGLQVRASHVRVEGFELRGYDESGIDLHGSVGGTVVDCHVHHCNRHGIFAYYAPRSTIVRPRVHDCAAQGISLRTSPESAVLGGRSDDNGLDGLLLLQDSDGVLVHGFAARGNRRGVALIDRSDHARLVDLDLRGNEQPLALNPDCDAARVDLRLR